MATRTQQPKETGRYYWADGKKIPLSASSKFLAIAADRKSGSTSSSAAERLFAKTTPMDQNLDVLHIPEHDLMVVAVRDQAAAPGAPRGANGSSSTKQGEPAAQRQALVSLIQESPDLDTGPPVYETAESGPMTALIPIGEIVVRVAGDAGSEQVKRLFAKHKVEIKEEDYPVPGCYLLTVKGKQDTLDVANALQESDLIEHSEPNFVILTPRVDRVLHPDDVEPELTPDLITTEFVPHTGAELAEYGTPAADVEDPTGVAAGPTADPGFSAQWNLQKIRAPQAWTISQGRPDISVAVLDEGCDLSHEDIQYKLPGYDAFATDNNPQPDGNDAHGTACAGVVAMRKDNSKGGVGVAPRCRVVPVRIAKGVGGGFWSTTSVKVADGIYKAVQAPRRADVLSNSYRVAESSIVTSAFNYARTHGRGGKGCCIAAAAGNDNAPPVAYPARLSNSIPGMMAVSATNQWDQRKSTTSMDGEWWWGSSFGPEVDIAAPGVKIFAPDISGASGYASGSYVPNFNGTSAATPHVAGLMGLILSVDPGLRSWEVEDIIKLTADDLGPAGRDQEFGFGRINCRRALEAASRIWYQITVQPVFLGRGRDCYMRANIRMYNPGINTVRLDGLTMRSFTSNWATEIDRWEYRPRPGNVLRPRTGDDVRYRRVLLRANGNQASYTYRWSLNWSYTFWRPNAPGFSLDASSAATIAEGESQQVTAAPIRGAGGSVRSTTQMADPMDQHLPDGPVGQTNGHAHGFQAEVGGDSLTIDRNSKSITVVIR